MRNESYLTRGEDGDLGATGESTKSATAEQRQDEDHFQVRRLSYENGRACTLSIDRVGDRVTIGNVSNAYFQDDPILGGGGSALSFDAENVEGDHVRSVLIDQYAVFSRFTVSGQASHRVIDRWTEKLDAHGKPPFVLGETFVIGESMRIPYLSADGYTVTAIAAMYSATPGGADMGDALSPFSAALALIDEHEAKHG